MPRLTRALIKKAHGINPLLTLLLRPCRDLKSARNELRWLRDFAKERERNNSLVVGLKSSLLGLCMRRSRGEPLQYLLGTQPFAELSILCRKGVLIPRSDTENYVTHLTDLLTGLSDRARLFGAAADLHIKEIPSLRILDLCTGTGCIPLLLYNRLNGRTRSLYVQGVDISPRAVNLARKNLAYNVNLRTLPEMGMHDTSFVQGDALNDTDIGQEGFDIIVSNPPYISKTSFDRQTEPSVRRYEPRNALIPDCEEHLADGDVDLTGDVFYDKLMGIGQRAKAKLLVMEVEDQAQAERVMASEICSTDESYWKPYAIWCDDVGWTGDSAVKQLPIQRKVEVRLEGTSNARAVVLVRRDKEAKT